jgi:hypothetical protein
MQFLLRTSETNNPHFNSIFFILKISIHILYSHTHLRTRYYSRNIVKTTLKYREEARRGRTHGVPQDEAYGAALPLWHHPTTTCVIGARVVEHAECGALANVRGPLAQSLPYNTTNHRVGVKSITTPHCAIFCSSSISWTLLISRYDTSSHIHGMGNKIYSLRKPLFSKLLYQ